MVRVSHGWQRIPSLSFMPIIFQRPTKIVPRPYLVRTLSVSKHLDEVWTRYGQGASEGLIYINHIRHYMPHF